MARTLAIGPYNESDRAELRDRLDAQFLNGPDEIGALAESERTLVEAIAYMGHAPVGASEMDLLPKLGMIANYGVGYDAIDVGAATERNIRVTNTPNVLNDDVADIAIAMLLMQGRQMRAAETWARSGDWAAKGAYPLTRKVSGGKAGIVGLGRIGREIADRLAAFKMEIHYWARSEKETPGWVFHDTPVKLAQEVDFLFIALVGGKETEKLVSAEVISALGPTGVLINISRGSTVDESALLDALENGRLGGAGLDVFLNEPDFDPRFTALDNVVLQPHQGSATVETRAAMGQLQRDNVAAFLAGEPLLSPVN